jgi:hypothetical protein
LSGGAAGIGASFITVPFVVFKLSEQRISGD